MIKQNDFLKHVQSKHFFEHHKKVLIAVSGGIDSMNLLHFLYVSRESLQIEIGIVHINHHQRPESEEEEKYLRKWSVNNAIPFYVGHFKGEFSEKKARDFRYAFFKEIMKTQKYTALVTAHHAGDQAETIFMRFIRGSRLRFQTGIKERQPFADGELIRPLLIFSKEELPDIFHFEDSSNSSQTFLRNRIRNNYLVNLKEENPKLEKTLVSYGKEVDLLIQALKELTKTIDKQDCQIFQNQTPAIQSFLLEDYLNGFPDLQLTQAQFQQLLDNLNQNKTYEYYLKNDYYFKKSIDRFTISKIGLKSDSCVSEILLEYGSLVKFENYEFNFNDQSDIQGVPINLTSKTPVLLRHRKPGDRIRVKNINKKLRRFFIDEKITHSDRQNTVVIEQENQVIAVLCQDKTYLSNPDNNDIMKGKLYIQKI